MGISLVSLIVANIERVIGTLIDGELEEDQWLNPDHIGRSTKATGRGSAALFLLTYIYLTHLLFIYLYILFLN